MITIMTPVFNRAYIIENLYKSLLTQSNNNFDWLIVDDGSTDSLRELVEKWQKDPARFFEMTYIYRDNGGKHRAWNSALQHIKGEWTFVVDSDDFLLDDAIDKVTKWINEVEDDLSFCGVAGQKGRVSQDGNLCSCGGFPRKKDFVDATNIQRYYNNLLGDKAEIYRTSDLRKHPFPEYEGEKFCSEGAVYGPIALEGKKLRWHRDIIYVCDYLEDGLTKNQALDRTKCFKGYTYVMVNQGLYESFPFNYIEIGNYARCVKKLGMTRVQGAQLLGISRNKYRIGEVVGTIYKMLLRMKHAGKNNQRVI